MENFPQLNFATSPVVLKRSMISKSISSSKNRYILTHTTDELSPMNQRLSSTPKKSRIVFLNKEIMRLDEELDIQEIACNKQIFQDFTDEKEKEKELKKYETYLDGFIHCIANIDSRIARCFNRG